MQFIKIYDKDYNELTTLSSEDFTSLSHTNGFGEIGSADFTVMLASDKVNTTSMRKFNRIEIISDKEVKWSGIILDLKIQLDTAQIRCRELEFILKRRILGASYVANDSIADIAEDILTTINAVENTGITLGDVSGATGTINTTFKYANAYEVLAQITKASGYQFRVNEARQLVIASVLGTDLSESVVMKYNQNQISASNILQFRVDDNGDNIVTKSLGKSASLTSAKENATLKSKFGVLEKFRDFRVANSQQVLDDFTDAEILGEQYSPQIDLNPSAPDNFTVGDTVKVVLKNALVDINDNFQVLEKTVQYIGTQKRIKVRINELPYDLAKRLADRDSRLDLLEKET